MTSSRATILDIGSSTTRIGLSGESRPVIDESKYAGVTRGRVSDYDVWTSSWVHPPEDASSAVSGMDVESPPGNDALIVESIWENNPQDVRSKLAEIAFEKRNATGLFFASAPTLATYANARQTALVVDLAGSGCSASAVIDGWVARDTNVELSELGGIALDQWIASKNKGATPQQVEKWRRLPDGTRVNEYGGASPLDLLFDPTSLGRPEAYTELPELVFTAATKGSSSELRKTLLHNIVLTGGLSLTAGLPQRLIDKVGAMALLDTPRLICAGEEDRRLGAWIGGSILASLEIFDEIKITKAYYDEVGAAKCVRKCP